MRTINGDSIGIGWKTTALVLLVSTLAFLAFYANAYFSEDFEGMLGYEMKETFAQLLAFFRSADQGSSFFWDPVYFQYLPRFPQAPLYSPVTLFLILLHKVFHFSDAKFFFGFLLVFLALLQIFCIYPIYLFLRYCGFKNLPSTLGGLAYAYNLQTFVFGIKHGYERLSGILLAPLYLLTFFKAIQEGNSPAERRVYTALTALLLGVALIANGDVKPTVYFCIFMVLAALFSRPFHRRKLLVLLLIFSLAGVIFLVHALPTLYAFRETARGQESLASILDYSLRPVKFLLTQVTTNFTDRPDYPWENTAEFSLSIILLALLGLCHLFRHRMGPLILAALGVASLWIMGKYTPLAPLLGEVMRLTGLRHPARMRMLLYFCYAFLAALGAARLSADRCNRIVAAILFLVPLAVAVLALNNPGVVPVRYVILAFLSWLVIFLAAWGVLAWKFLWLIALFFILERTTLFSTLEESNVGDPTEYYTYDEIFSTRPRAEAILRDRDYREYKAFFGVKDYPKLFSHNFCLNAVSDGIRPIFAYFLLDEEMKRVREVQEVIFADWSNPMWDLLNVKYFVDLDRYFAYWDEEDTSKIGLDHLRSIDERVRVNPGVEKEVFVRYRSEPVGSDGSFLANLKSGEADVKNVAYLNDPEGPSIGPAVAVRGGVISIISRKPDEITAAVTVPAEAVVVFSEFWFFPWRAEVDGEDAELFRAYNILQAVKVPAGTHRVRFYFDSRHWKFVVPRALSSGLALALLIYLLYWWRRGRREEGAG